MKVVTIAENVWKFELNEDSSVSIPYLCSYFRANVGELNNLLGTSYTLDSNTLEIIDENGAEISGEAANIYKYMYLLSFYARQMRANLGVGGIAQGIALESDGGSIRLVSKTDIAKVYQQLRKDIVAEMKTLINKWKIGNQTSKDVTGDDIIVANNNYYNNNEVGVLFQRDLY